MLIYNSLGIEAYQMRTAGNLNLTIMANNGEEETAGWSADSRIDFKKLEIEKVTRTATQKAINGFGAKLIEPGNYEVVLEPAAIGGLAMFACIFGLSATMYQEYRSYLRDKIGEKIFSEKLDLWSDPLNSECVHSSLFDEEGVPTQRLDLINEGVVKSLVYDTYTGTKDGVASTGHKRRWFGDRYLPLPSHLFMKEGDSTLDEMIAETKKGILVTHFHYQNAVNPAKGVFTGLTRDGTWLIEHGEVVTPVKTLRYTDEVTRFFENIDLVGTYSGLKDTCNPFLPGLFPSVKLPTFRFSGSQAQ
jgi:predicted Zn-dependent protease